MSVFGIRNSSSSVILIVSQLVRTSNKEASTNICRTAIILIVQVIKGLSFVIAKTYVALARTWFPVVLSFREVVECRVHWVKGVAWRHLVDALGNKSVVVLFTY
jgi:hypothetical protein